MTKMFLTYNGTIEQFKNATKEGKSYEEYYENSIVFISGDGDKNGEGIYTHGQYFGSVNELTAQLGNLKYFSKISVNGTPAEATGADSTLAFTSIDPAALELEVSTTGISIGLTETFKQSVADNTNNISNINERLTELDGIDVDHEDRIANLETLLKGGAEGDDSVPIQIANALNEAKSYTNTQVSVLGERVTANEEAIEAIASNYLTSSDKTELEEAIETAKEEAIAAVLGENVDADFDTLKEVADWILSDTTGAAALQTTVAQHTQDIEDIKDDIDTLETDLSNEITRSTEKDTELSNKLGELEQSITDNTEVIAGYTVNGQKISSNPVLVASDIQTTSHGDIDTAVDALFELWEWGEA